MLPRAVALPPPVSAPSGGGSGSLKLRISLPAPVSQGGTDGVGGGTDDEGGEVPGAAGGSPPISGGSPAPASPLPADTIDGDHSDTSATETVATASPLTTPPPPPLDNDGLGGGLPTPAFTHPGTEAIQILPTAVAASVAQPRGSASIDMLLGWQQTTISRQARALKATHGALKRRLRVRVAAAPDAAAVADAAVAVARTVPLVGAACVTASWALSDAAVAMAEEDKCSVADSDSAVDGVNGVERERGDDKQVANGGGDDDADANGDAGGGGSGDGGGGGIGSGAHGDGGDGVNGAAGDGDAVARLPVRGRPASAAAAAVVAAEGIQKGWIRLPLESYAPTEPLRSHGGTLFVEGPLRVDWVPRQAWPNAPAPGVSASIATDADDLVRAARAAEAAAAAPGVAVNTAGGGGGGGGSGGGGGVSGGAGSGAGGAGAVPGAAGGGEAADTPGVVPKGKALAAKDSKPPKSSKSDKAASPDAPADTREAPVSKADKSHKPDKPDKLHRAENPDRLHKTDKPYHSKADKGHPHKAARSPKGLAKADDWADREDDHAETAPVKARDAKRKGGAGDEEGDGEGGKRRRRR